MQENITFAAGFEINIHFMGNKRKRLQIISEILKAHVVGNQEELQALLAQHDCEVTQATLSRDLKQLKVAKTPLPNGTYKYVLPPVNQPPFPEAGTVNHFASGAVLSIDFSGQLAVIKTSVVNAMAIRIDDCPHNGSFRNFEITQIIGLKISLNIVYFLWCDNLSSPVMALI